MSSFYEENNRLKLEAQEFACIFDEKSTIQDLPPKVNLLLFFLILKRDV